MQRFECMGDSRHKKPPPDEIEEENTPEFREAALEALAHNARLNRIRKKHKDDEGYLIGNYAELGRKIGTGTRMVKTTAPGRAGTKTNERAMLERKMVAEWSLLRRKDPQAYRKLMRLLARLSADVARRQQKSRPAV